MASAAPPMQMISLGRRERNMNLSVGSFNPNKKHSDKARWACIYPAYLNSRRTVAQGRQLPARLSVENPTCNEIRDVLLNAGFQVEVETAKVFPRELNKYDNLSRGRVRFQLKNDDSTPVKANLTNRKAVLVYLAETIPKLKTRGSSAVTKSGGTSGGTAGDAAKSSAGKKGNKKK